MIDSLKDHLVPIISKMKTARIMIKSPKDLHEIKNTTRAFSLRQQLHHIKMAQGEAVISYFMKITELKDSIKYCIWCGCIFPLKLESFPSVASVFCVFELSALYIVLFLV